MKMLHACRVMTSSCESVTLYKYPEYVKNYWITIKDIKLLTKGETAKILFFDRNYDELPEILNPTLKKGYDPCYFFSENYIIEYTHDHDLTGTAYWVNEDEEGNFEFEIQFKKGWYPLQNGYLPESDWQGVAKFGEAAGNHYSEFPENTPIGWRGPCVFWKDLKYMPKVHMISLEEHLNQLQ